MEIPLLNLLHKELGFVLVLLILKSPTIFCLHREGGQPVPSSIIKEARELRSRYHHVLTNLDTQRRILKKLQGNGPRGDLKTTFSIQILEEHLFQPIQPKADNELLLQSGDNNNNNNNNKDHDTTRNAISLRQVGLEGTATPLFFCSQCTQNDQEECARCKGLVISQQQQIIRAVKELFPEKQQQQQEEEEGRATLKIVASTQKLINVIFIEMAIGPNDDIAEIDHALSHIPGVQKIIPQEDSTLEVSNAAAVAYIGGGSTLEQKFCGVGGKGVKVAILDSGVDYTHQRFGGAGTKAAYQLAYGTGPDSPENKQVNPEIFPTEIVIGGKDFLGESFVHTAESVAEDANPDDNPIDANRHGTMVADAVLSVAPQAKLLACKVCTSDEGTCPGFAVIQALEYALDPNGDDNTSDHVDIVNLSLGGSYLNSHYDLRTAAMEKAFELGVLPVVAAGNEGNIPYIGGPGPKTPNAMSVAATNGWSKGTHSMVATYSSRGPGDENLLKPDISAPSGLTLAAKGTGRYFYKGVQGTSFAAPLVAGALALVKERCPKCSPFALKAVLMNNAKRQVQYHTSKVPMGGTTLPTDDAPNSLVGAGELQLDKSLEADVWAYCVEDTQASLSFGLINAHKDMTLTKTIKVMNMSGKEQTLRIRNQFSAKALTEPQQNPFIISFLPEEKVLPAGCNTEVEFEVRLVVDASKAPPNRMTSGGEASNNPANIDWNEFGGWVIIENVDTSKDISLPYHSIVRQASNVVVQGTRVIQDFTGGATPVNVKLTNLGAGVAQVDAFELLFTSEDDPENDYGSEITPSDFRYIGYRAFQPEGQAGTCDILLEFSFTTWEKQKRLNLEFFQVHFDTDFDGKVDYVLFNSGVFTPFTDNIGCIVRNKITGELKCTGFSPDHSTNTGNTILRVCSNDIGFATAPTSQQRVNVYILTATATHLGVTEVTDRASEQFHTIEFPKAFISTPSYDIYPGETLETLEIDGTGGDGTSKPLGLMLVTNSYRSPSSTGASSTESETIILTNGPQNLPVEVTPDDLAFPVASALQGPECSAWEDVSSCLTGTGVRRTLQAGITVNFAANTVPAGASSDASSKEIDEPEVSKQTKGALHATMQSSCPETDTPRSQVLRVPGSAAANIPTIPPTPKPTPNPSRMPYPTHPPSPFPTPTATTSKPTPTPTPNPTRESTFPPSPFPTPPPSPPPSPIPSPQPTPTPSPYNILEKAIVTLDPRFRWYHQGDTNNVINGDNRHEDHLFYPSTTIGHCLFRTEFAPWVQIDLGSAKLVYGVRIWHFWGDQRQYCSQGLKVSTDGVSWKTVFDTGHKWGPKESPEGRYHAFGPHVIRYLRHYAGPSTVNNAIHFLRIEVDGMEISDTNNLIAGISRNLEAEMINLHSDTNDYINLKTNEVLQKIEQTCSTQASDGRQLGIGCTEESLKVQCAFNPEGSNISEDGKNLFVREGPRKVNTGFSYSIKGCCSDMIDISVSVASNEADERTSVFLTQVIQTEGGEETPLIYVAPRTCNPEGKEEGLWTVCDPSPIGRRFYDVHITATDRATGKEAQDLCRVIVLGKGSQEGELRGGEGGELTRQKLRELTQASPLMAVVGTLSLQQLCAG